MTEPAEHRSHDALMEALRKAERWMSRPSTAHACYCSAEETDSACACGLESNNHPSPCRARPGRGGKTVSTPHESGVDATEARAEQMREARLEAEQNAPQPTAADLRAARAIYLAFDSSRDPDDVAQIAAIIAREHVQEREELRRGKG